MTSEINFTNFSTSVSSILTITLALYYLFVSSVHKPFTTVVLFCENVHHYFEMWPWIFTVRQSPPQCSRRFPAWLGSPLVIFQTIYLTILPLLSSFTPSFTIYPFSLFCFLIVKYSDLMLLFFTSLSRHTCKYVDSIFIFSSR